MSDQREVAQINSTNQIKKGGQKQLDSKEFSRSGAKQENFNKTGKILFKDLNLPKGPSGGNKPNKSQEKGPKRFAHLLPENKSEMGGGDPDELDEMEMQAMKAGINNPDINRALG